MGEVGVVILDRPPQSSKRSILSGRIVLLKRVIAEAPVWFKPFSSTVVFKNLREADIPWSVKCLLKVDDGLEPASVMLEILFFSFSDRPGVCRGMLLAVLKPRNCLLYTSDAADES